MQGEAARITLLVTKTLEQIGVPHAVGGSLASSLHGVMRSTLDADIVADMKLEHIQPLVAARDRSAQIDRAGIYQPPDWRGIEHQHPHGGESPRELVGETWTAQPRGTGEVRARAWVD